MKMTKSAERKLDAIAQEYKESIISQMSNLKPNYEIKEEDVVQAKNEVDRYNYNSNEDVKRLIKRQRMVMLMTLMSITYVFIGLVFYVLSKDYNETSVMNLSVVIAIISSVTAIIAAFTMLYLRRKRKNIPDKRKLMFDFIDKWKLIEKLLRERSYGNNPKNHSLLNAMQSFLDEFDDNYTGKAKDFHYVLNVRNKIVHENADSFSEAELKEAIDKEDKLLFEMTRNNNNGKAE